MKAIYWASTSLVALMIFVSAMTYLFHKGTIDGVKELGFPDFFRVQLAVLKIIGVAMLVLPQMPLQVKEWAYAGIGLFYITAIVAHSAHGDPIALSLISVFFFALLVVSNVYLHKMSF
ncbi:MAG: DoxX family protein [Calditrichia bacterium]